MSDRPVPAQHWPRFRVRSLCVTAAPAWLAVVLALEEVTRSAWDAVGAEGPARPEDAITLLTGLAGLVVAGWLGLATVVSLLAVSLAVARPTGGATALANLMAGRIAPAALRRAVVLSVGVGLAGAGPALAHPVSAGPVTAVAGPAAPGRTGPGRADGLAGLAGASSRATADPATALDPAWAVASRLGWTPTGSGAPVTGPGAAPDASALDPAWAPLPPDPAGAAWPAAPAPPVAAAITAGTGRGGGTDSDDGARSPGALSDRSNTTGTGPRRTDLPGPTARDRRDQPVVVVRHGDCLWDIVAREFGPGASPARIAAEWRRWYAVNRAVIGPDPDLLQPGQRLHPPGTGTSTESGDGGR